MISSIFDQFTLSDLFAVVIMAFAINGFLASPMYRWVNKQFRRFFLTRHTIEEEEEITKSESRWQMERKVKFKQLGDRHRRLFLLKKNLTMQGFTHWQEGFGDAILEYLIYINKDQMEYFKDE